DTPTNQRHGRQQTSGLRRRNRSNWPGATNPEIPFTFLEAVAGAIAACTSAGGSFLGSVEDAETSRFSASGSRARVADSSSEVASNPRTSPMKKMKWQPMVVARRRRGEAARSNHRPTPASSTPSPPAHKECKRTQPRAIHGREFIRDHSDTVIG